MASSVCVNIFLRICSMIVSVRQKIDLGWGGGECNKGGGLKGYVSLHRREGVKKLLKLAL